jgi:hypothetical protein
MGGCSCRAKGGTINAKITAEKKETNLSSMGEAAFVTRHSITSRDEMAQAKLNRNTSFSEAVNADVIEGEKTA